MYAMLAFNNQPSLLGLVAPKLKGRPHAFEVAANGPFVIPYLGIQTFNNFSGVLDIT